jgi:hypothetical protein
MLNRSWLSPPSVPVAVESGSATSDTDFAFAEARKIDRAKPPPLPVTIDSVLVIGMEFDISIPMTRPVYERNYRRLSEGCQTDCARYLTKPFNQKIAPDVCLPIGMRSGSRGGQERDEVGAEGKGSVLHRTLFIVS